MSDKLNNVLEIALSLSAGERAHAAAKLLESLGDRDDRASPAEIEKSWADEAERRVQAHRDGKIDAEPGEDVMKELRAKYAK